MFDIKFLVDDRKLASVLMALDGLALNLQVQPVRNAVVKNGKIKQVGEGGMMDEMLAYFRKHKLTDPTPEDIRNACIASGRSKDSYSYIIGKLINTGALKRTGTHPQNYKYHVVRK